MKYAKSVLVVFLATILLCTFVSASGTIQGEEGAQVTVSTVEVNDVNLEGLSGPKDLEKTDILDVLVVFSMNKSINDVQIRVELTGYDLSDKDKVTDETDKFDVKAGDVYDKRLNLELPVRFQQGAYSLKVRFDTPKGSFTQLYSLNINTKGHLLEIRDIVLSPENEVKAGRALLTTVRLKNRGEAKEEDIKVKVSIPSLGVSASDYLDELDQEDCNTEDCDDSTSSEELYLRIPDCAAAGEYTVKVAVEFDDGDEEVVETTKIRVVESDTCGVLALEEPIAGVGKTVITIGPETQDVNQGASVMYPITIANQGTQSKTYAISVDSADWAAFSITPSNVLVIGPSESKAAYVAVKANQNAAGSQVFSVTVKSGETVLKQVPLKANVIGATSTGISLSKIKKALEIGLVILVVLLVILGLIIGFNKLKGSEEESSEEEKTYY